MTPEQRSRKVAHEFGSVLTAIEEHRLAEVIHVAIEDAVLARERDIERAVRAIGHAQNYWMDDKAAACLRTARQALQPLPEAPMPETEIEMLARLGQLGRPASAWIDLDPQDVDAIRWAVATMKRYKGALESLRDLRSIHSIDLLVSLEPWDNRTRSVPVLLANNVHDIADAALLPAPPAPAETEATK
jgi:hypothetical protein